MRGEFYGTGIMTSRPRISQDEIDGEAQDATGDYNGQAVHYKTA